MPRRAMEPDRTPPPTASTSSRVRVAVAVVSVLAVVAPLWVGRHLPAVDVPQHLFLTHVLRALAHADSPYHATYTAGPRLTYVTFYGFVAAVSAWVGEESALRAWLTLQLAAIPLAMAALLRALRRSPWAALLALPVVYTDNFYWGLVSFQSSIPWTILAVAALIGTLDAPARSRWPWALGVSLVMLQLTHAAGMILPALSVPALVWLTPSDRARRLRAAWSMAPGAGLFALWLSMGVHRDRALGAPGEPWKAVAPLFDARSFAFTPVSVRVTRWFDLLGSGFRDHADRAPIVAWLVAVVAVGALARRRIPSPREDRRPWALLALAAGCYLALPTDVRGYMYMLAPRYAQLVALWMIPCVAPTDEVTARRLVPVAAALALWTGVSLASLFARFDDEATAFERVVQVIPRGARVLHMVVDARSAVAQKPVYIHYAALAALRREGTPSFSLALDPSFPVNYVAGRRPPGPADEWRPLDVSFDRDVPAYDVALARGRVGHMLARHPDAVTRVVEEGPWSVWRVTR